MSELVWREDNGCLGEYQGNPVYLKKGKFGLYAEWTTENGKQTISLKPLSKSANEILLEDVIKLIKQKSNPMNQEDAAAMFLPQSVLEGDGIREDLSIDKYGYGQAAKSNVESSSPMVSSGDNMTSEKTLIRALRPDLSIRKGKFGPYIFHKNAKMSKPAFHPIKPFKDKWESMANLELIAAIENTYRISI
jgi:topoisomerase IA-like protein